MIEVGDIILYDLDEVSIFLKIKKSTLRNYIYSNKDIIKSTKLGGARYINKTDLENYLKGDPFGEKV